MMNQPLIFGTHRTTVKSLSSHPSHASHCPRRRSITNGPGAGGAAEPSKRSVSALAKPSKTSSRSLASYAKKGQKAKSWKGHGHYVQRGD